jgi:hypothetical protein
MNTNPSHQHRCKPGLSTNITVVAALTCGFLVKRRRQPLEVGLVGIIVPLSSRGGHLQ